MRYRLVFAVGVGVGFVLGARAGRERYEQIRTLARKAADSPAVQQAAAALQAQATEFAKTAKDKLIDQAGTARSRVGEALHDRMPGMRTRDANGHSHAEDTRYARSPGRSSSPPSS